MIKRQAKKLLTFALMLAVLIPTFIWPLTVNAAVSSANTLAELRKELASYQARKNAADANKAKTQSQITSNKNQIMSAHTEIDNNREKIEQAKKDIETLNGEIETTKGKLEEIMRSYEITDGDNAYLEYIFNAKTISDFIIRYNVSEQLASYNDDLIDDYSKKVEQNEQLKADLAKREEDLNEQISSLESSIDSLGSKLSSFIEEALDAADDIKSTQELIKYYENMGCKENEDFNTCVSIKAASGFIKPLNKGTLTSPFGYRTHPITGKKSSFHSGTDIGGNSEGTNVYAAAPGMVGKIIRKASCGGNQVYIYHTINGQKYTSGYMHLLNISVSIGDKVDVNTVVGHVGGGAGTRAWETCSTGAHLHFMIGTGWYGSTYVSYSTWVANLKDPAVIVKIPAKGKWFYSRY